MNGPANVLLCGGAGGGETFDHHICASLRREVAQFQIAVAGSKLGRVLYFQPAAPVVP